MATVTAEEKAEKAKATAIKDNEYEVQAGETLLDVAHKFGVTAGTLAQINHLTTGHRNPAPGTKIKIRRD